MFRLVLLPQVNVVHQQVLRALAEVLAEDVLLPPNVLDMLGGARSEENSLAKSSQNLGSDSEALDETEVSSGIPLEKAPENVEDSQSNITSCRNEVGTTITKDEQVTAEMDKGSMVADSFHSEQECCAEFALAWEHAKEGKGNYYEAYGEVERQVQEMLELNLIEPPKAEIAHYIVCVAKKDACIRMCVDFGTLNAVTKIPVFSTKDMQELIIIAGSAHWLTSLDILKGY
ncbi:CCHC-type domain-containing protein [Nephila pilipes]|uniref:CCHC-type domain-containing protein n=1 Tax=Nephila pilipes TaxID=299642 RepID=A0A8X6QND2_NEPPI|nr:CCHC-type domain-containing protein [Nephila pilipes]